MFSKIYEWFIKFIKSNYKEIIFLIVFAFAMFYKFPYIVYKPGGAIDITPRISVEGKDGINGSYSMNYVSVSRGNIPNILLSYIIKDWQLEKEQNITIGDIDYDTSFKIEQLEYKNAIFLAIYNACRINNDCTINIDKEEVNVIAIDENANTDLKLLDKIINVDGTDITDFRQIRNYVLSKKEGDIIHLKVLDNDREIDRTAVVYLRDGNPVIGISGYTTYEYTTDPVINIATRNSEAGPSGGLMLSLALYDYLSDEDIANGRKVMGTGTIDENGHIGPIGGIKYKMLGAKKGKADIFFSPMDNCEDALSIKKEYNIKYEVKCVETFSDAINYLTSN